MESALDKVLQRLDESGYDVSSIDDKVDEFSTLISEARDNWNLGREKFTEFRTSDKLSENKDLLDEAKDYFETAHSKVKEANSKLVEIRKLLKETTGKDENLDDEDVELEIEKEDPLPPPSPKIDDEIESLKGSKDDIVNQEVEE